MPRDNSFDELVHFRFIGDVYDVAIELVSVPSGESLQGIELFLLLYT